MVEAKFFIGQIVLHRRFNYRGVIVEVDPVFSNSEQWYETMAISKPPKDKPWYSVLVDRASHLTYVAQRNLSVSDDSSQIDHPSLGYYFNRYDGQRYFMKQKTN